MQLHIIKDELNGKYFFTYFLCEWMQRKWDKAYKIKINSNQNNGYYYHKQANRTNPSNSIHVHVQYFKMICKRFLMPSISLWHIWHLLYVLMQYLQ